MTTQPCKSMHGCAQRTAALALIRECAPQPEPNTRMIGLSLFSATGASSLPLPLLPILRS